MPKAYWIAHVTITEPVAYSRYASGATEAFKKYGGKVLARAGKAIGLEGDFRDRNVAIEFASLDEALTCYNSAEYQSAKDHRQNAGSVQLVILEGVDEATTPLTAAAALSSAD